MTPEIAAAKRRLEDQATELPNWARQLLDYIAHTERLLAAAKCPECDGSGSNAECCGREVQNVEGGPFVCCGSPQEVQCRWCYERTAALSGGA